MTRIAAAADRILPDARPAGSGPLERPDEEHAVERHDNVSRNDRECPWPAGHLLMPQEASAGLTFEISCAVGLC
jgi:hypothetical protein